MVEVSCINVHPWFAAFPQDHVFNGGWYVSFVCSGGVATYWHSLFLSAIPVCCQCHAIHTTGLHKTITQETQPTRCKQGSPGHCPALVQGPPHLDAGTDDPLLTPQYEQTGLLKKSHNADERHGPSDTCQCVIATRVSMELDWLWM